MTRRVSKNSGRLRSAAEAAAAGGTRAAMARHKAKTNSECSSPEQFVVAEARLEAFRASAALMFFSGDSISVFRSAFVAKGRVAAFRSLDASGVPSFGAGVTDSRRGSISVAKSVTRNKWCRRGLESETVRPSYRTSEPT